MVLLIVRFLRSAGSKGVRRRLTPTETAACTNIPDQQGFAAGKTLLMVIEIQF